jgi:hypothetical protein
MKEISYEKALEEIKKGDTSLHTEYFVYPFGHTSSTSEKVLRELNYKLAFTTKPGFVTRASDRLYLPRQRVSAKLSLKGFAALLQ